MSFHSESDYFMPTISYADEAKEECRAIVQGLVDAGLWDARCIHYFEPQNRDGGWFARATINGVRSIEILATTDVSIWIYDHTKGNSKTLRCDRQRGE